MTINDLPHTEDLFMLNVVLFQPSIPPNTGNVARQCIGMNARLHLIEPMGFKISDKQIQRAGLDYWQHLNLTMHDSPEAFITWLGDRTPWLVTKFGHTRYDKAAFKDEDVIIFGNENKGIPQGWHDLYPDQCLTIPMNDNIRSYNLSNAVALVVAQANVTANLY